MGFNEVSLGKFLKYGVAIAMLFVLFAGEYFSGFRSSCDLSAFYLYGFSSFEECVALTLGGYFFVFLVVILIFLMYDFLGYCFSEVKRLKKWVNLKDNYLKKKSV